MGLMAPGYEVDRANKYGETPLYITCKSGYYEVVRLLLDNGAEVDRAASDYDGDRPRPPTASPSIFALRRRRDGARRRPRRPRPSPRPCRRTQRSSPSTTSSPSAANARRSLSRSPNQNQNPNLKLNYYIVAVIGWRSTFQRSSLMTMTVKRSIKYFDRDFCIDHLKFWYIHFALLRPQLLPPVVLKPGRRKRANTFS